MNREQKENTKMTNHMTSEDLEKWRAFRRKWHGSEPDAPIKSEVLSPSLAPLTPEEKDSSTWEVGCSDKAATMPPEYYAEFDELLGEDRLEATFLSTSKESD